jgi:tetratricopeptide (TPR) repeat protein
LKDEKNKKDSYEKALAAYGEAIREFHKGRLDRAKELLQAFLEKHNTERELVDRANIYLQIAAGRGKKETVSLKTGEDYFYYGVYKINSGAYEEALKLLEKAAEMKEDEGRVYYLMADAYILLGKPEESMECLKKAFQKDKFYKIMAQNETDFEPLWEDKKFKLITRMT